jgi:hypothetical protein
VLKSTTLPARRHPYLLHWLAHIFPSPYNLQPYLYCISVSTHKVVHTKSPWTPTPNSASQSASAPPAATPTPPPSPSPHIPSPPSPLKTGTPHPPNIHLSHRPAPPPNKNACATTRCTRHQIQRPRSKPTLRSIRMRRRHIRASSTRARARSSSIGCALRIMRRS